MVSMAVFSLAGCGVSKEEHEKTVSELNETRAMLEKANARVAEMEKSILNIPKIDPNLKDKLQAAEQRVGDLTQQVKKFTVENKDLNSQLSKYRSTISDLENQLKAFQEQSKNLPLDMFKTP
jgi:chromosome segregation protein